MSTIDILTTISDILIFIAYFAIPAELWYFYSRLTVRSRNFPSEFKQVLYLFVLFIFSCGLTHLFMSFHSYYPMLIVNCVMKIFTAIVSLYTSYQLIIVIPRVLYYPIYTQNVEQENLERKVHEQYLQQNLSIFRRIRGYTQKIDTSSIKEIFKDVVNILYESMNLYTALYVLHTDNENYVKVVSCPFDFNLPNEISLDQVQSMNNTHDLWLIEFNVPNSKGFFLIKMKPTETRITTRKSLVLRGQGDEESQMLLPETEASVLINRIDNTFITDIVVDIIEHFEMTLQQLYVEKRNDELIDELKKQNILLTKARAESQNIAKQSRDWLSVMSHEMRTPLFAVESLAELLLEGISPKDANMYSSVSLISQSAKHLSEIINNVLDFTKLENGEYTLESVEFNLRDIVTDAFSINVRNEKRMYPQSSVKFSDDLPEFLLGDALRLKQIFLNLINNAVKFTTDEESIIVELWTEPIPDDPTSLILKSEVRDTGIGIKDADRNKIFRQFSQSDATITRKFGGTGLGLSICKRLCKLMEGDIDFRKNEPKGTIFFFNVKVKKSNVRTEELNSPPEIRQWKIFVLDSSNHLNETTVRHFKQIGCTNVYATNVCEELEKQVADVYFINIRSPCLMNNLERMRNFISDKQENVLMQANPFMKKYMDVSSKYEILGPVIPKELCLMMTSMAVTKGLLPQSILYKNKDVQKEIPLHILVAEDNKVNQIVLRQILTKLGVNADFADDGDIAVKMYDPNKHEVILMDIMMPNMDGYTATKEIRKISENMKKPWIIALTANAFWEDRVKAMEAGMNDFLTKPTKLKDIRSALEKVKKEMPPLSIDAVTKEKQPPG